MKVKNKLLTILSLLMLSVSTAGATWFFASDASASWTSPKHDHSGGDCDSGVCIGDFKFLTITPKVSSFTVSKSSEYECSDLLDKETVNIFDLFTVKDNDVEITDYNTLLSKVTIAYSQEVEDKGEGIFGSSLTSKGSKDVKIILIAKDDETLTSTIKGTSSATIGGHNYSTTTDYTDGSKSYTGSSWLYDDSFDHYSTGSDHCSKGNTYYRKTYARNYTFVRTYTYTHTCQCCSHSYTTSDTDTLSGTDYNYSSSTYVYSYNTGYTGTGHDVRSTTSSYSSKSYGSWGSWSSYCPSNSLSGCSGNKETYSCIETRSRSVTITTCTYTYEYCTCCSYSWKSSCSYSYDYDTDYETNTKPYTVYGSHNFGSIGSRYCFCTYCGAVSRISPCIDNS